MHEPYIRQQSEGFNFLPASFRDGENEAGRLPMGVGWVPEYLTHINLIIPRPDRRKKRHLKKRVREVEDVAIRRDKSDDFDATSEDSSQGRREDPIKAANIVEKVCCTITFQKVKMSDLRVRRLLKELEMVRSETAFIADVQICEGDVGKWQVVCFTCVY